MPDMHACIERLFEIRERMGWLYGSEDLCVLLYSLVKRARPQNVVELGTGFGVSTAWIAAALKENETGVLHSYDNGSHYASDPARRFLAELEGPLRALIEPGQDYPSFMRALLAWAGVADFAQVHVEDIDFAAIATAPALHGGIDMLFSDFNHSPDSIQALLGHFLPRLSSTASVFIDSASTQRLSYLTLERIVDDLNCNKIPVGLARCWAPQEASAAIDRVQRSRFRLMHLIEGRARAQNSTAWLSIEPVDVVPTVAEFFH